MLFTALIWVRLGWLCSQGLFVLQNNTGGEQQAQSLILLKGWAGLSSYWVHRWRHSWSEIGSFSPGKRFGPASPEIKRRKQTLKLLVYSWSSLFMAKTKRWRVWMHLCVCARTLECVLGWLHLGGENLWAKWLFQRKTLSTLFSGRLGHGKQNTPQMKAPAPDKLRQMTTCLKVAPTLRSVR